MIKRASLWSLLIILLISVSLPVEAADNFLTESEVVETNWEKSVIQARGYGVAPNNIQNEAQAMILAREAAITVAQRRLIGKIKGVQIDSEQKVNNVQVKSDVIIKRVRGSIRGAQIIEEKKIAKNAYQVVLEVKFYGQDGIIKAIFPQLEQKRNNSSLQTDNNKTGESVEAEGSSYTGVIINTVNLRVKPALAPKIFDSRGNLVYGVSLLKSDKVIQRGIVGYTRSLADAKANSRVGNNPLILQAKRVRGNYKTDLVLAGEEARQLQRVGKTNNIFNDCKLIIVLN